jgi:hypothetical protein
MKWGSGPKVTVHAITQPWTLVARKINLASVFDYVRVTGYAEAISINSIAHHFRIAD